MPLTLADIARETGVTKMTVSRAANNIRLIYAETSERVLGVARWMNYQLNQHRFNWGSLTLQRSCLSWRVKRFIPFASLIALIMGVLANGGNPLGISSFTQQIVIGAVVVLAVMF